MPFADIIGHTRVLDLLRRAVSSRRVPQSLLFAGPAGVGKHAVAVALAQALNCPARRQGQRDDACGTCPTCERIAAGRHSDVVFVDKGDEASIKIRQLRERVLDVAGYRPFEAEHRVFVIDPAEAMTAEAQDALLKTLEEPPTSAIIALVSAYPDTLRPTILSRCRRVRFGPLADEEVVRVLTERLDVPAARARVLASVAGGSPARALAEDAGDLDADREAALGLLEAAGRPAVGPRLKAATALVQHRSKRRDREVLSTRLALVASLMRDLGLMGTGSSAALANEDLAETLGRLQPAFDPGRAVRAFEAIDRARQALERNASPKIVADWLAVTL